MSLPAYFHNSIEAKAIKLMGRMLRAEKEAPVRKKPRQSSNVVSFLAGHGPIARLLGRPIECHDATEDANAWFSLVAPDREGWAAIRLSHRAVADWGESLTPADCHAAKDRLAKAFQIVASLLEKAGFGLKIYHTPFLCQHPADPGASRFPPRIWTGTLRFQVPSNSLGRAL